MATNTELGRIAAAMHALRPDWPLGSLITHLQRDHAVRPVRDLAVACAWIAADPETKTPARLREHGPWWTAAYAGGETPVTGLPPGPRVARCPIHEHEPERCRSCRADWLETGAWPDRTRHPERTR